MDRANLNMSQSQTPHRFGAMPGITVGLLQAKKSYVERRSWLHPFKSFFRVFSFLAMSFHILVCIAFLEYINTTFDPSASIKGYCLFLSDFLVYFDADYVPFVSVLGSVLLTMSCMNLLGELLYLWSLTGMEMLSSSQTFGSFLRLLLKGGLFISLALYYIWSFTSEFGPADAERRSTHLIPLGWPGYTEMLNGSWEIFKFIALLYLVPWVICLVPQFVPEFGQALMSYPLLTRFSSVWWPSHTLYIGNHMAEHEKACFKSAPLFHLIVRLFFH